MGHSAMHVVEQCKGQVDFQTMINDAEFTGRIQRFSSNEPTLVMFLNKHVLNMTLNWLCNTKHMEGVHERTVMVTLDDESNGNLAQLWPNIARLPFVVPCLKLRGWEIPVVLRTSF